MKLLREATQHQLYFDSQPQELRSGLEAKGIKIAEKWSLSLSCWTAWTHQTN